MFAVRLATNQTPRLETRNTFLLAKIDFLKSPFGQRALGPSTFPIFCKHFQVSMFCRAFPGKTGDGTAIATYSRFLWSCSAASHHSSVGPCCPRAVRSFAATLTVFAHALIFFFEQGTAAGRGSAASLEFLEETFKTAAGKGAGYSKADRSSESGDGKDDDEDFAASKPAGNDLGGGDAENNRGDEKGSKGWDKNADDSDDAISVGVRERDTSGGRGGDTGGAANEPPDGSDGGSAGVTGFGVVGEDATVELALQALSKVRVRVFVVGVEVFVCFRC